MRHRYPSHLSFVLVAALLTACGDDGNPAATPDAGTDSGDSGLPDDGSATDTGIDEEQALRDLILGVPETGRFVIPGLTGEVHVVRTEMNIPHLYADNREDLHRVQGFVLARDRYFQFELARRLAQGRLSELLGELGLSIDQQSAGQGMRLVTQRLWTRLTDSQRADFEAFAVGINAYVQAAKAGTQPLPSELITVGPLLGAENPADLMQEVAGIDVAAFGSFVVFQLGYETTDLLRESIWQAADSMYDGTEPLAALREAALQLDIINHVAPAVNVSSADGFPGEQNKSNDLSPAVPSPTDFQTSLRLDPAWQSRLARRHERTQSMFRREDGGEYGSNTWAMGPDATGGNGTLVAGDGHLGLGVAPFFYQMGRHLGPFGDGSIHEVGLYFPGLPMMGVGTNGRVAWSQTYLYGDITDFYALPVQLNAAGEPATYGADATALNEVEESYAIAAVLGAEARTETWSRWTTANDLWLADIEGTLLESADDANGQTVVTMQGDLIVPGDTNGDGEITGIFFDYVAFDPGNTITAVEQFAQADNIDEFREATRGLVGYAGNFVAADADGNILYTSYNATPCRLPLGEFGNGEAWDPALDPRRVITGDATGFDIPLTAEGNIDESTGRDPVSCVVPFDEWPVALNPAKGFVANANNDPSGATFDNNMFNDPWYIGYGFSTGYRAGTIEQGLSELAASQTADLNAMADLQGEIRSSVAVEFLDDLQAAVDAARLAESGSALRAAYDVNPSQVDEAMVRLTDWARDGYQAESGVDTFYETATEQSRADAVATMIFNQWLKEVVLLAFGDEPIELAFAPSPNEIRLRTLRLMVNHRGPDGEDAIAGWNPETQESALWDVLGTDRIETSDEIIVQALTNALATLSGPDRGPDKGGFETTDMSAWLWGLRHQVRFRSLLVDYAGDSPIVEIVAGDFAINTNVLPLAESYSEGDPRQRLTWFPRHGDLFAVDAPNYQLISDNYYYSSGPVMRMVMSLNNGVTEGRNILPGGQSGRMESEHFADQCSLWLGNDTVPMRLDVAQVVEGATGREFYTGQ